LGLGEAHVAECALFLQKIYEFFWKTDASMVEINPLALVSEGATKKLLALDAKVTFDDNGVFRHPKLKELFDPTEVDAKELEALMPLVINYKSTSYLRLGKGGEDIIHKSEIKKANGDSFNPKRFYEPALPTHYNKGKKNEKICLSFFVTIAYEDKDLNILNINLLCMPNGELEKHYGTRVLSAGKNPDKSRFNFTKTPNFELLGKLESRVKVVYFNEYMSAKLKKDLAFYEKTLKHQNGL
jgi:hypothetical protein